MFCVKRLVGKHRTTHLGFIYFCPNSSTWGSCLHIAHGALTSYRSAFLMALLMYGTVQGDREQWFWGLVWAQKVEQLNAALSLPFRLLHIQQVTHFFLPSPQPDTSQCCLEGGVGFLGEEKGTIIHFSLTAD